MKTYFIATDNTGHYKLIPINKRSEIVKFLKEDSNGFRWKNIEDANIGLVMNTMSEEDFIYSLNTYCCSNQEYFCVVSVEED